MDVQDRNIFQFDNGTRKVWADPLTMLRRLDAALGNPDAVFADMKDPDPKVRLAATECLIVNAREVFGMPAIDPDTGEGVVEELVRAAVQALWDCLAKKKPSGAGSPTSCPPTM